MSEKVSKITVEVGVKMDIEKKTAEGCLKLVEMYINDTGSEVYEARDFDGTYTLRFRKRPYKDEHSEE